MNASAAIEIIPNMETARTPVAQIETSFLISEQ